MRPVAGNTFTQTEHCLARVEDFQITASPFTGSADQLSRNEIVLDGMERQLRDSAKGQLSKSCPAILFVQSHDLTEAPVTRLYRPAWQCVKNANHDLRFINESIACPYPYSCVQVAWLVACYHGARNAPCEWQLIFHSKCNVFAVWRSSLFDFWTQRIDSVPSKTRIE